MRVSSRLSELLVELRVWAYGGRAGGGKAAAYRVRAKHLTARKRPTKKATMWYNEAAFMGKHPMQDSCHNDVSDYTVPHALDWMSVDQYHMDGYVDGWVDMYPRAFYDRHIFPNLTTQQSAVLVPGSFGSHVNRNCNNR